MSRRHKIKHLTSDELKSQLYAHFQKTGSLDHLRSQLRGQLVSELFKVSERVNVDKFPGASDVDKCLLPIQVCNWLVYDHLSRQDYQYSLSTFVSEAQLPYPEKFLTAGDILKLLGLDHSTTEFINISKLYSEKNELEYLHSLLLALLKTLFNIPKRESVLSQTHNQEREMDNSVVKKRSTDQTDSNEHFSESRRNVLEASFNGEFSRPRDLDRSFHSNYDVRSADLSFQDQLQSVKKESEREVQKLRHKLLEELENLHAQEHKMQLEVEFTKSELKKEEIKLKKERELLKDKEVLLEKEIRNKCEMKLRDVESDFAAKLHFKDKEIQSLKSKLTENEQKLACIEIELSREKDNHSLLERELEDFKHMNKITQDKYSTVLDENTNLVKRFENMTDYALLKEELAAKTNEVRRLQNEIRDIHLRSETERKKYVETVRNLEENLNRKDPQLIQARKELDQVQNTFTTEKSLWDMERKRLEQELCEFKELYRTVIQRMDDQKEDVQDLQQTIHVLNYKLTNNVINLTKSETLAPFRSIHTSAGTSMKSKTENLFSKRNVYLQPPSKEKYNDSSPKYLSDSKSRCGKLVQEEDAIQEKYSYVFSSIPEFNKQPQSYLKNCTVSMPKSDIENYNYIPFSKSGNVSSSSSPNNWSKNKLTSDIRSPYSLNDVKRMVSSSLFSHKSGNYVDSLTSIGNIDLSSKIPNSNFKGISKRSEVFLPFDTNVRHNFPTLNENVSVLDRDIETSKSSRNEHSHNQPIIPHSKEASDSIVPESKDPGSSQNYELISNQKQKDLNKEPPQLESESANKNLPEILRPPPFNTNKNTPSLPEDIPKSLDSDNQNKGDDCESVSVHTSQEISDNVIAEKIENRPNNAKYISSEFGWG